MNQHEYAGCGPDDLDESLRQLKADGRKVLDFWRNQRGRWLFKLMVVRA
jgi:hypothetical protein